MSDKEANDIPRRKALLTTAGIGSTLVGLPRLATADKGKGRSKRNDDSEYILDKDYWTNEDGELVIPESELDK